MNVATRRKYLASQTHAVVMAVLLLGSAARAETLQTAAPVPATTPATLEQSLVGDWRGALEYRDYQSNEISQLPMDTHVTLGKDGATLTRLSIFDDGPVTGLVYITTVSLFDGSGARMTNAVFRKGREVDVWTDDAKVVRYTDESDWSVVYQHAGIDGGTKSDVRVTQTLAHGELLAVKEVKPVDAPDSAFTFRNQVRLKRIAKVAPK
jgi:hypothetical protein